MPPVSLTTSEQAGLAAADSLLDQACASGMTNPDASPNVLPLQGYAAAANVRGADYRPQVRGPFQMAALTLARALASFVEPTTLVSSFTNSWVNFDVSVSNAAGFYKGLDGRVWLQGRVKSGIVGSAMFTLPAGYRPAKVVQWAVDSNGAHGTLKVEASGDVTLAVGSNVSASLEGLSFRI